MSICQPWKGAESVTTERDGRLKRHLNDEMSDEIKKMHALNENAHFEYIYIFLDPSNSASAA